MFDIGFGEMIILAVIALIAIGPKQLPEVARVIGRFMNELRRMTGDFTQTFMSTRDSANQFLLDTQNQIDKSLNTPVESPSNPVSSHDPLSNAGTPPHSPVESLAEGGRAEANQMSFAMDGQQGRPQEPVAVGTVKTEKDSVSNGG